MSDILKDPEDDYRIKQEDIEWIFKSKHTFNNCHIKIYNTELYGVKCKMEKNYTIYCGYWKAKKTVYCIEGEVGQFKDFDGMKHKANILAERLKKQLTRKL